MNRGKGLLRMIWINFDSKKSKLRYVCRPVCLGVKAPSGAQEQIIVTVRHLRVYWRETPSMTIGLFPARNNSHYPKFRKFPCFYYYCHRHFMRTESQKIHTELGQPVTEMIMLIPLKVAFSGQGAEWPSERGGKGKKFLPGIKPRLSKLVAGYFIDLSCSRTEATRRMLIPL